MNEIESKCPECGCISGDVLCINAGLEVIVKCVAMHHQYILDHKKNHDWQEFFKKKTIKLVESQD